MSLLLLFQSGGTPTPTPTPTPTVTVEVLPKIGMFLIRPKTIDETTLFSSTISEAPPAVWSNSTTYALNNRISIITGTSVQIYKSLSDDNLNNDPASSPAWWVIGAKTYTVWSGATTYALGDRVINVTTHRVYESLQAANLNHDPTDTANVIWWLDVGPTNKWAMFDSYNGTTTTHPYQIDVTMHLTGRVDSLALLNLVNAVSARVIVSTAADGELSDQSFPLISTDGITDWYSYYFEEIDRKTTLLVTSLPTYADPQVRVSIEGNGESNVECGLLSVGMSKYLGKTLHDGARVGIDSYSRKDVDAFGNYTIVPRAFNKRGSFQMRLEKSSVDTVYSTLVSFRDTPAVYSASREYGATMIFGFFSEFNIEIDRPGESLVSVEIKGLT